MLSAPKICLYLLLIPTMGIAQNIQLHLPNSPTAKLAKQYFVGVKSQIYNNIYVLADTNTQQANILKHGLKPSAKLPAEGFAVQLKGKSVFLLASDKTGMLYGLAELADALKQGTVNKLDGQAIKPYIAKRGLKFNLPLDLRSPTYNDAGDANQHNITNMWDLTFWQEMLDAMAYNRYNTLTLWSLQPWPSMVKVPEFPEIALADVWKTKTKYDDTYSTRGDDLDRPQLYAEVEIVKKMTIEQKIAHWQTVMQMADDRGIGVYLFTWNLFTYGTNQKYGITAQQSNEQTIAWYRASVREMIKTYPLLKGIGITAGEGMENNRADEYANEKWLWRTYGLGINDALALQPNREFTLIHRFHWAALDDIEAAFSNLHCKLELSLKYVVAHMYSIPNPRLIDEALPMLSAQRKSWLTIRNDDVFSFRWANYNYAQSFIKNIPELDKIAGIYMGPDGYCWGRDYLSKTDKNHQLVLHKQWLSFLQWGRLAYNPNTPKAFFEQKTKEKLGDASLLPAWESASMVFPYITRFVWGDFDFRWFPEANWSLPSFKGFYTVKDYIERQPMPGSGVKSILEWSYAMADSSQLKGQSPLSIADSLQAIYLKTNAFARKYKSILHTAPGELAQTKSDIVTMGLLAKYYSEKRKAAAALALYDATSQPQYHHQALQNIQKAATSWQQYATAYHQKNHPALYNRVGFVDLHAFKKYVANDIQIVQNWKPGTNNLQLQGSTERPFRKSYQGIKKD
jgi:hypothetical protein